MASLVPGYEYDIFISYRQKDNRYDGWVSEFVDNLKKELETAFKEEISVYFDINPHDGLLDTHDVDASLKEKLQCLIFIPIISRTYCDPKSFAWEHEFKAFIDHAASDKFGLKVKLPGGNVASRILPVRIHDLDPEDIMMCESVLGGTIRSIDFVYTEPGVNRPLTTEDDEDINLGKTKYRNQINKTANAIREIVTGLIAKNNLLEPDETILTESWQVSKKENKKIEFLRLHGKQIKILIILLTIILCLSCVFVLYRVLIERTTSKTLAIIPLGYPYNDTALKNYGDIFTEAIHDKLGEVKRLTVRPRISVLQYRDTKKSLNTISKELDVNYVIVGNIRREVDDIVLWIELVSIKVNRQLWSGEYIWDKDRLSQTVYSIIQVVASNLKTSLTTEEIKLIETEPTKNAEANLNYTFANVISYDAWSSFSMGNRLMQSTSFLSAIETYDKAIEGDSLFAKAYANRAIARSWGYYTGELDNTHIDKCLEDINKALEINSDLPEAQNALGFYYYYCIEDLEKAIEHFNIAAEKNPQDYRPMFYMSIVYRKMGEWSKSQELLRKVIKLNPQEALYLTNIGLSYNYLKDYDSAIIFHQKAIEIMPSWPASYSNLIETIILKNGNPDEALALVDTVIERTGNNFLEWRILLNIYKRNFVEALNDTEKADSSDFEIKGKKFLYMAIINKYLNNEKSAMTYFDSALVSFNYDLVIDSNNPLIHSTAGVAYAGKGDKVKAIEEADITHNLMKNDINFESQIIINLSKIYTMIGEYDQAVSSIEYLLNTPSSFSLKLIKLNPVWEPLLMQPEFIQLETKYSKE